MASKRTYGDACGIPRALDLVGERWALLVVRELVLGPKRFTDLRAGLPGVTPDVLTQRLKDLVAHGVVQRRRLPPPAAAQVYELTGWGQELAPVLAAIGRWGARAPAPPTGVGMSFDAHVLTLSSLFREDLAGDLDLTLALHLGEQGFTVRIAGGRLAVDRGEPAHADATIIASPGAFVDVLHGRRALADAQAAGDMTLEGDLRLAERFTTLFPLPEPAPVPVG